MCELGITKCLPFTRIIRLLDLEISIEYSQRKKSLDNQTVYSYIWPLNSNNTKLVLARVLFTNTAITLCYYKKEK